MVTPDEPEQPDSGAATPQDPAEQQPDPAARSEGPYADLSDLPAPPPQVSLISDVDLSWLDKPQKTDEQLERRQERKEAHRRKVRRKRRTKKALKITAVGLVFSLVLGAIWFQWTFGELERMPASSGRAGLNTPGTTMLLIGSNPEEPDVTAVSDSGWQRTLSTSDLVMLLHLTRDNRAMFVISIPADSLLPIPGLGEGKLADAFARGGQDLYVRTIEEFSGVRLDRVAAMDMNALREITDQLGGVILDVPREACGVPAGPRRLDGKQSLDYMALQPCLPRRDLDRVERQQSMLRALMRGAVDGGKVTNPFRVQKMLRSTASNLTLEDGYSYPSMFGTLFSMRRLRSSNTTFLTVPTATKANVLVNGVAAIRLDPVKDAALWDALRRDQLAEYLATNEDAVVLE